MDGNIASFSQRDSQSGIDIRQALDILSKRAPNNLGMKQDHSNSDDTKKISSLKRMGQTIDMFAPSSNSSQSLSESRTQNATVTSTSGDNSATPGEQRQQIRDSLKDIPFISLLKMVLTAQEDRVRTHRLYDEALGKVLMSNRLTDYPPACVAATAAFAVLSDTVSAIREELSDRVDMKKDPSVSSSVSLGVIKGIKDLQESERQKLQLTAACHLERIRANNLKQSIPSDDDASNDDESEGNVRELKMLNEGVADLRSRIETCRSDINSIIEDLRCALVEQIEEDDER